MNTQITEDYCSFEVAKLLKEKGFNEPTCGYYYDGYMNTLLIATTSCHNGSINATAAPSQAQAMKWLREVHKIDIDITSRWNLTPEYHICEYRYRLHYSNAPNHDINQKFNTYEEACEAAIKYCLTNLI